MASPRRWFLCRCEVGLPEAAGRRLSYDGRTLRFVFQETGRRRLGYDRCVVVRRVLAEAEADHRFFFGPRAQRCSVLRCLAPNSVFERRALTSPVFLRAMPSSEGSGACSRAGAPNEATNGYARPRRGYTEVCIRYHTDTISIPLPAAERHSRGTPPRRVSGRCERLCGAAGQPPGAVDAAPPQQRCPRSDSREATTARSRH